MIYGTLLGFHIIICAALILVVLLQSGKGGGLAGAFGAAGGQTGQTLFGGRGAATFLSKATTALGSVFLLTSLVLALLQAGAEGPRSLIRASDPGTVSPPLTAPAPATGLEDLQLPVAGDDAVVPGEVPAPGQPDAGTSTENPGEDAPGGGN